MRPKSALHCNLKQTEEEGNCGIGKIQSGAQFFDVRLCVLLPQQKMPGSLYSSLREVETRQTMSPVAYLFDSRTCTRWSEEIDKISYEGICGLQPHK